MIKPNAAPVAVISAKYWHTRFGGDPQSLARSCAFNNVPVTIVGVITPELVDVQQAFHDSPDIAVPLALDAQLATVRRRRRACPPCRVARARLSGGCRSWAG